MNEEEKEAIKYFYNLRATIDESNMLFNEDINVKCGKETIKQITILLNLLEKKDKRISDLEYALIDMVMQFADRPKIKDCYYALSTMGLSALETAFVELDFDDPIPIAEAEKRYKELVDKYFERKVENGN